MRRLASGTIGRNPPTNLVGRRGELAFERAITSYSSGRPLFWPAFLGDKWPTIDYYIELLGIVGSTPHLFAQVKSTSVPLSPKAKALRVNVSKERLVKLYELPGPTYLVGVHEPTERIFVLSIHTRPVRGISRIPFANELNPTNLDVLHREVSAFWRSVRSKPAVSSFT